MKIIWVGHESPSAEILQIFQSRLSFHCHSPGALDHALAQKGRLALLIRFEHLSENKMTALLQLRQKNPKTYFILFYQTCEVSERLPSFIKAGFILCSEKEKSSWPGLLERFFQDRHSRLRSFQRNRMEVSAGLKPFESGEKFQSVQMLDFSPQGASVRLPRKNFNLDFAPKSFVSVNYQTQNRQKVEVHAVVAWWKNISEQDYILGLRFIARG